MRHRLGGLGVLFLVTLALPVSVAQAASPLKIREVFPGSVAYGPNAEYVMLQMTAAGQNDINGQTLQFYDAAGTVASTYAIPSDVANGSSQRTVLLATQEAVENFPELPGPDFNIGGGASRMSPSGGGVCLVGAGSGLNDCVTWGSIPLATLQNPYLPDGQVANAPPIGDEAALRRTIARGCVTYLDSADDTTNSANDFSQVEPSPRDNSALPSETRCPPDTALSTFPTNPSNLSFALFTYGSLPTDEPAVSFECKLDAAGFAACPNSGKSYPGPLSEGSHTFQVRAVGEGGADPTPKSFTWTIDLKAPETMIDGFPPEPSGGFSAAFSYSSSEPSSSFKCQLDGGPVQVCAAAGKTYFQLADGLHTFRVWATDNAGNQDPTPAEKTFTVQGVLIDGTPPDTSIVSAPAARSSSDSASLRYASTEEGSRFECSLNGSPFASCAASGSSYSRLRNGAYLFAVRAIDPAGNVDSVPASYAWTVAAPLPKVSFTKAPPGKIRLRRGARASLLFRFKADKPHSSFRCRLDKRPFKECSTTTRLRAPVGRHRFEVYAIDELGNVGAEIERRIVRIQKPSGNGLF